MCEKNMKNQTQEYYRYSNCLNCSIEQIRQCYPTETVKESALSMAQAKNFCSQVEQKKAIIALPELSNLRLTIQRIRLSHHTVARFFPTVPLIYRVNVVSCF